MHDVACEFARAVVRSKDAQKQLVRTSLSTNFIRPIYPNTTIPPGSFIS